MIGQLRGKLIEKHPPHLMIEVNGVGYCLQAPLSTFFVLPGVNEEVVLRTHLIVREDAHILYGFNTKDECRLFQEIIKINGVGPKVALAILSGLSPQEFADIIMSQELSRLQRLPGIGAKTAQRIIVEMQDRLTKINITSSSTFSSTILSGAIIANDPVQEAIAALVSLGYKQSEAVKAVSKVQQSAHCEQIIKEALQGLAKV